MMPNLSQFCRQFYTLLMVLAFCSMSNASANEPLKVVATTGMIANTAAIIGGDAVNVQALMGSGVDPHAYRQTRSDIVALSKANLVLWHGLFLEAQLEPLMPELAERGNVFAVAESVAKELLIAHDDYQDKFDPHVWMDPGLWSIVADNINGSLSLIAPELESQFDANSEAFRSELSKLQDYSTDTLSLIPKEQRILITAHDAFNYFGRAYDFEVMGIQGLSTESEAGIKRIEDLVDVIVTRKIKTVFIESSVSDRNIRALIEGAAAQGHEVVIGGKLFSDAMGSEGTYEGTYIGMIDHNITTIARAFGVDVNPAGMNGKLSISEKTNN